MTVIQQSLSPTALLHYHLFLNRTGCTDDYFKSSHDEDDTHNRWS